MYADQGLLSTYYPASGRKRAVSRILAHGSPSDTLSRPPRPRRNKGWRGSRKCWSLHIVRAHLESNPLRTIEAARRDCREFVLDCSDRHPARSSHPGQGGRSAHGPPRSLGRDQRIRFPWTARRTASARLRAPSFEIMLLTCDSAVRGEISRREAMSALRRPS